MYTVSIERGVWSRYQRATNSLIYSAICLRTIPVFLHHQIKILILKNPIIFSPTQHFGGRVVFFCCCFFCSVFDKSMKHNSKELLINIPSYIYFISSYCNVQDPSSFLSNGIVNPGSPESYNV